MYGHDDDVCACLPERFDAADDVALAQSRPAGAVYADFQTVLCGIYLGLAGSCPADAGAVERGLCIGQTLFSKIIGVVIAERYIFHTAVFQNVRIGSRRLKLKQRGGGQRLVGEGAFQIGKCEFVVFEIFHRPGKRPREAVLVDIGIVVVVILAGSQRAVAHHGNHERFRLLCLWRRLCACLCICGWLGSLQSRERKAAADDCVVCENAHANAKQQRGNGSDDEKNAGTGTLHNHNSPTSGNIINETAGNVNIRTCRNAGKGVK